MPNPNLSNLNRTAHARRRRAFTLVELMVVLMIIALLGSMVLFAMFNAQGAAREAKTKNMISKLNALIMPRYQSYLTRRVPINRGANENDVSLRYRRLQALRELMRMEMPERWTDVRDEPLTGIQRPAVNRTYQRKITTRGDGDAFQGAESLYLIVAFGLEDADALAHFSQSDIGDVDGDGLNEFLDGWGRPISFLRWPAGFGMNHTNSLLDVPGRQSRDLNKDFDQFNQRKIEDRPASVQPTPPPQMPRRFALYPLIYSAGADGKYDIGTGGVDASGNAVPLHYSVRVNQSIPGYFDADFVDPYIPLDNNGLQVGQPNDNDADGSLDHGDNIHNHDLTIR